MTDPRVRGRIVLRSDRKQTRGPGPVKTSRPAEAGGVHVKHVFCDPETGHRRAHDRWQDTLPRDRPARQAGQRRGRGPPGRHDDPGGHRGRPRARGARLLPAHGRLPREGLLRGQVPRRVHQAGRAAHHQGNPHLPADRPPDPPALPRHVTATRSRSRPARSRPTARTTPTSSRSSGPRPRCVLARVPFLGPDRGHPAGPDRRRSSSPSRRPRSSPRATSTSSSPAPIAPSS